MAEQLHKRFHDEQIKPLMERYLAKEIKINYVLEMLGIKRWRFFELLKQYKYNPDVFSIQYTRKTINRKMGKEIEKNIFKELSEKKKLIESKDMPIKFYNYSYIKGQLWNKYQQKVSLFTIIKRAKKNNFYFSKPKKKAHELELLTNYVGELFQHDSSYHKWSPYADNKWYLIITLDDYSRNLLYGDFVITETTWDHILALESVLLRYGLPLSCYVDNHSIFRFVQGRDSIWQKYYKMTNEAETQWKQVLNGCQVKVAYALSPQAKGKIERPYGWLQDGIVRTCAR